MQNILLQVGLPDLHHQPGVDNVHKGLAIGYQQDRVHLVKRLLQNS